MFFCNEPTIIVSLCCVEYSGIIRGLRQALAQTYLKCNCLNRAYLKSSCEDYGRVIDRVNAPPLLLLHTCVWLNSVRPGPRHISTLSVELSTYERLSVNGSDKTAFTVVTLYTIIKVNCVIITYFKRLSVFLFCFPLNLFHRIIYQFHELAM